MKAMLLEHAAPIESSPLKLVDLPTPEPAAGEVRVRVHCCGVCRTDLHVVEGDLAPQKMPLIPGHEIVGAVDAVGPDCRRLRIGQRVGVAWLRWTCGRCRFCAAGRENLCESARFTGYQADGGYAEFAVVPEEFAYEIPAAFTDVEAAPLLAPASSATAPEERSQLPPGGRIGLYGFGSSAHLLIQIVRHRGAEVYVVARDEKHRELARRLGAAWTGARVEDVPVLVQSAILFAPVGEMVPPALEKLDKGGTLALAGIYMSPIPSMDYERCVFFERDIHSVTSNTRADGRELLAEAAKIPIHPHTVTYPLSEANRALQELKEDRINGTGVLIVKNQ